MVLCNISTYGLYLICIFLSVTCRSSVWAYKLFPRSNFCDRFFLQKNNIEGRYNMYARNRLLLLSTIQPESAEVIAKTEMIDTATNAPVYLPKDTSYCYCGSCKTAFVISDSEYNNKRGLKVKCNVCEKEWFQTQERMSKTDEANFLTNLSESKIEDVKRIIRDRNTPKYPRVDKIELFVGNLPYTFDENNILELFAEYGVSNVALVKDNEQKSKGFAFIELTNKADAELAAKEMHQFYVEPNRRLTVRVSDPQNSNNGGAPRQPRSNSDNSGTGGGKKWTTRPGPGEKKF